MAASLYSRVKSAYELHEKEGWYSHTVSYMSPPEDYFSDKRACVLACIREEEDGELSLLLTVRSAKVSSFQGQVCFPGGIEEDGDDSLVATALREAEEEINLKPSQVNVIGLLPPFSVFTKQLHKCYAVMATLDETREPLRLDPNEEVSDYFWMPLKYFINSGPHHWQSKAHFLGIHYHLNCFKYKASNGRSYEVYGLTAKFCITVAMVACNQPPHYPCLLRSSEPRKDKKEKKLPVLRHPGGYSLVSKL